MTKHDYVYEMIDTTNDEIYYPIGIFLSLDNAIAAVDPDSNPDAYDEYDSSQDGFYTLAIHKRKVGFCGHGSPVHKFEWVSKYDSDLGKYGDYHWSFESVSLTNKR